jgi:hypothetical protein
VHRKGVACPRGSKRPFRPRTSGQASQVVRSTTFLIAALSCAALFCLRAPPTSPRRQPSKRPSQRSALTRSVLLSQSPSRVTPPTTLKAPLQAKRSHAQRSSVSEPLARHLADNPQSAPPSEALSRAAFFCLRAPRTSPRRQPSKRPSQRSTAVPCPGWYGHFFGILRPVVVASSICRDHYIFGVANVRDTTCGYRGGALWTRVHTRQQAPQLRLEKNILATLQIGVDPIGDLPYSPRTLERRSGHQPPSSATHKCNRTQHTFNPTVARNSTNLWNHVVG